MTEQNKCVARKSRFMVFWGVYGLRSNWTNLYPILINFKLIILTAFLLLFSRQPFYLGFRLHIDNILSVFVTLKSHFNPFSPLFALFVATNGTFCNFIDFFLRDLYSICVLFEVLGLFFSIFHPSKTHTIEFLFPALKLTLNIIMQSF